MRKHKIVWTKRVTEFFEEAANLTPLEKEFLETRIAGMTRKEQAAYFNVGERTVYRIIDGLLQKYDAVQAEYPNELKPRFVSEEERYLDDN